MVVSAAGDASVSTTYGVYTDISMGRDGYMDYPYSNWFGSQYKLDRSYGESMQASTCASHFCWPCLSTPYGHDRGAPAYAYKPQVHTPGLGGLC